MKKRSVALMLALAMAVSLTACGGSKKAIPDHQLRQHSQ